MKIIAISIFLLVIAGGFSVPQRVHADVWGAAYAATILDNALETAREEMWGAILGTLKVTAYELLHTQVGQLIGGTNTSDALIISDWEDFIVKQPGKKTALYMNDFFSASFQGKNTCDYVPLSVGNPDPLQDTIVSSCGVVQEGVRFVRNYPAYLEQYARAQIGGAVAEGVKTAKSYTLDQFCDDPSKMFAQGNFKCWDAYYANSYNNPFGYANIAQERYLSELQKRQEIARIQSIAYQGYKPATTEDGRYVVTPGSLIKDMQAAVVDLGNKIIAAAKNPAEFLSSLVSSFVTSFIRETIQNGVGQLQQHIRTEIRDIDSKTSSELRRVMDEFGPNARYYDLYVSEEWYDRGSGGSGGGDTPTKSYCFDFGCSNSTCCSAFVSYAGVDVFNGYCGEQSTCQRSLSSAQETLESFRNVACLGGTEGVPASCCTTFWSSGKTCQAQ